MKFNEKLKKLRTEKGYTQEYVANKLNVARQSVSKWESGINEPDIETLKKLCLILDVSIANLIDDDKEVIITKEVKHTKIKKSLFLVMLGMLLFAVIALGVFSFYLPDKVIGNIGINGDVTYNSKWLFLIVYFGINLIPITVFYIFTTYEKKYDIYRQNSLITSVTLLVMQIVILCLQLVICFISITNYENIINKLMCGLLADLIIVLAIFSNPLINKTPKFSFGFRTTFTLTNKEAWYKINMLQSVLMLSVAIIFLVLSFIINNDVIIFFTLSILIAFIPTFIYHEILRKKKY